MASGGNIITGESENFAVGTFSSTPFPRECLLSGFGVVSFLRDLKQLDFTRSTENYLLHENGR